MFQIYLIRHAETCRFSALEVGDYTTCDAHDVCRRCAEVVVPRSGSSPHFVELQQIRIHKHTQLSAVTKGRHATIGFGNSKGWAALSDDPPHSTRC